MNSQPQRTTRWGSIYVQSLEEPGQWGSTYVQSLEEPGRGDRGGGRLALLGRGLQPTGTDSRDPVWISGLLFILSYSAVLESMLCVFSVTSYGTLLPPG